MTAAKKRGNQSISFETPPVVCSWGSVVGPKEGEGPWADQFDLVLEDYMFGEKTWEQAESKMLEEVVKLSLSKKKLTTGDAELLLAGDLLNQLVSSNYAARQLAIPFLGLYGACSTISEALITGAMLLDGGFYERVVAAAGSHHYTSERQFRFPTEQGVQKTPSAQWTVTGAGAVVLQTAGLGPRITCATIGKVLDLGQTDASDMGSAMAPAAADTLKMHLDDMKRPSDYYDLVVTGDLGSVGMALATELFVKQGICPKPNYSDCGVLIYDDSQGINAGGSGCGCSASMLCGPLLKKMVEGKINRLLFIATGALMSPITSFQGETIPGIAHAVAIENYL
ncbi:MAG TPA: stage V sporulation protein AD [Syntrophomonadaceae bacterium]|nr:stage V sporulation protein AD [Syntrophomonadaceae bacterium]